MDDKIYKSRLQIMGMRRDSMNVSCSLRNGFFNKGVSCYVTFQMYTLKNVVGLRTSVIFLVNNVCSVIYNSIFSNMEIYYLIRFCFKKKTYLHNNFYIIYIQCLFNRVFQRKNSVIKIVKMAGGRITTPTVFKKECCSFADICTCINV